jgi:dephospho-CoA kinase
VIVIGLTGSIGMGKSTIASQCALLGAKTLNSDHVVHQLMQPGGKAYAAVRRAFPEAVKGGIIDRKALGAIVFPDAEKLRVLEEILHPLVKQAEQVFAGTMKKMGVRVVVFDIPLLFETGGDEWMDLSLVATAPAFIQKQRVMARKNMTAAKFKEIVAKQMPDREKRMRADMVVHTGLGKAASMRQIKLMFRILGI